MTKKVWMMTVLALWTVSVQAMPLVVKSLLKKASEASAGFPTALIIVVLALVLIFTVLLIISPRGSRRRRQKRRTIL